MNKTITSYVVDPSIQQPFTAPTLEFLQLANREMIAGVCRQQMGETLYNSSLTTGVCMSGGSFASFGNTFTEGFIFFNGELYYCSGATGLSSYVNVPVVILDEQFNPSYNPIKFTDLVNRNVNAQRRLTIADQVSGTGLFDLKDLLYVPQKQNTAAIATTTTTTTTGAALNITGAVYAVPAAITGITRKFKIRFTCHADFASSGLIEGGTVEIYNTTTAAVLATQVVTASASGGFQIPLSIEVKTPALAGGNSIVVRVTRYGSNNVSIINGYFTVEEVL